MCGSPGAVKVSLRINSGENERVDFSGGGRGREAGRFFSSNPFCFDLPVYYLKSMEASRFLRSPLCVQGSFNDFGSAITWLLD